MSESNSDLESIRTCLEPPTVVEELDQRANATAKLRELFLANPLRELDADELTKCAGPNYRSRIAELRAISYDMNIQLVRKFIVHADGKKTAALGAYVFKPYHELGRSAEELTPTAEGLLFDISPR